MPNKCNKNYLPKFKELGIVSDGTINAMEHAITAKGFGLPSKHIDENATEWVALLDEKNEPFEELQIVPRHYYGFTLRHGVTYTRLTLTYADALAEELILLKRLKLMG